MGLLAIVGLVNRVFWLLQLLVLAHVILSWVPRARYHPAAQWLARVVEPMLRPFRAIVPVGAGGIDFSPMILLAVLWLLQHVVTSVLLGFP